MSYRFLWKQIASRALSSAVAKALLTLDRDELWKRLSRTEKFTPEQMEKLRADIEARLSEVEESGRKERDLIAQVMHELVSGIIKPGGKT
ncbi:MAG: hypothetical protein FJ109_00235 [Deltaproteobacteria bacterium]|nr:hypothetical protein [Deltaproteobacteria bacterium]